MEDTRRGAHRVLERRGLTIARHTRTRLTTAPLSHLRWGWSDDRARLSPFRPALRASLHDDSRITPGKPKPSPSTLTITGDTLLRRPVELRWLALLLYSYAVGIRSSRQIERACAGDVAFKVIAAMSVPDHSAIAEFRRRDETAIGELFVSLLGLWGEAGLVRVGEISVDGTRMRANASRDRNRGNESIVTEILAEAGRVDREEDERHGNARGDELPEQMSLAKKNELNPVTRSKGHRPRERLRLTDAQIGIGHAPLAGGGGARRTS